TGPALVVRAGNPRGLHSFADLSGGQATRLGVVLGAIEHDLARRAGVPADRIAVFPDAPGALEAVAVGRIDAFAATSLTVNSLLATAGDDRLARASPFEPPVLDGAPAVGHGAFGFRRGDGLLRDAFDRELERFV